MAHQKSCSGTSAILTWGLADPSCVYGLKLTIDGQDVTAFVNEDNTQTAAQIEADLMAARIAPFTNVIISVSIVGNSLNVTISNVTLPSTSPGFFDITINNPGGICIVQSALGSFMTCTVLPHTPKKKRSGFALPGQVCIPADPSNPDYCPPTYIQYSRAVYQLVGKDKNGNCCYRLSRR